MDRFTTSINALLLRASNIAVGLGHNEIDTAHVLVALVESPGPLAEALTALGLTPTAGRDELERLLGRSEPPAPQGHIPFSPDLRHALASASPYAANGGRPMADVPDLLLAMLDQSQSQAFTIIRSLRVEPDAIRLVAVSEQQNSS